jgi:Icc-related predicted phosphoesterase
MVNIGDRLVEAAGIRLLGLPDGELYRPSGKSNATAVARAAKLAGSGDFAKPLVLVGHYPPWRSSISGLRHLTPDSGGSATVGAILEVLRPALMITGHYHQDFGQEDRMSGCRTVNPGPTGAILALS